MKLYPKERVDHFVADTNTTLSETQKANLVTWLKDGNYALDFDNRQHLMFLVDCLNSQESEFVRLLYIQDWRVYIARGSCKFITSDSPVVEWFSQLRSPFEAKAFIQKRHYLALTPELLLELTYPIGDSPKVRRRTLYADQDDVVRMYNLLIADKAFQYAYATRTQQLGEILNSVTSDTKAGRLYIQQFGSRK